MVYWRGGRPARGSVHGEKPQRSYGRPVGGYTPLSFTQTADSAQGYGALGRETARLLKSFGMTIIAANTSGKATPQDGVSPLPIFPGDVAEILAVCDPGDG